MSVPKRLEIKTQTPGGWRNRKMREDLSRFGKKDPTQGYCEIHKQNFRLKYGKCFKCNLIK